MLYTKLALVTCGFYLAVSILLDGAVFGTAWWKGSASVSATKSGWLMFFGLAWLMSFLFSWRIVVSPILARIQAVKPLMHR
jgi:hypothetical protein